MTKKKSHASRPYMIAASFFIILFILMKVQDVKTQSVAENPFDKIESPSVKASNSRDLASVSRETLISNSETNKSKGLEIIFFTKR